MPVCVECAAPADHLYTTYRTKSNIRLGVCTRCESFLDPLIEHPGLIVFLDLILLKPRAYLHLLYNRGTPPFDAEKRHPGPEATLYDRSAKLRGDLVKLCTATVVADTLAKLLPAIRLEAHIPAQLVLHAFFKAAVELSLQLVASTSLAMALLWSRGWLASQAKATRGKSVPTEGDVWLDGRRRDFRVILIPIIILYTSIVPLLFQLAISIWYDPPDPSTVPVPEQFNLAEAFGPVIHHVPPNILHELETVIQSLVHLWSTTDLIWAGTRLLGGMSAGFGLRVALPTRPWETIAIVLVGWGAAGLASDPAHALELVRTILG